MQEQQEYKGSTMQVDKFNLRILLATRQYMLYSVGLGALIVILLLAFFFPQSQEAYDTFNKIQKEKPNTAKLIHKRNALDSIPNTAEYAQIEIVDKALPSRKPVLELLMSLTTVAQNTNVVIDSFDLSPGIVATDEASMLKDRTKTKEAFDSLEVSLEVSGTFKQLQDFIIQVERVSPFSTITEMDLSGELDEAKAADEDQRFRAKLTSQTYFFTQPISVRIETPLPIITEKEYSVLGALAAFAPINVPLQTEVRGGGTEDLFRAVKEPNQDELIQQLLREREAAQASNSATPAQ